MKKLLLVTLVVLLFIATCNAFDHSWWGPDFYVNVDGEEYNGPFGWLLGVLLAGGGLVIGAVVIVCVALLVGLLFAGLGMLVVVGLAALGVAIAAALSPLLLPLAIVIGLVWYFNRRGKRRTAAMKEAAV
ncbi:hypothetical protein [Massilia sp. METH4]|uniref:hypothetical protein n=1 Tax=Massilia sp. METH4 TaxID=3123041 RepID=UPI0030D31B59